MSVELKIKSKHLSLEAQVIRFEENKLEKQIEWAKKNNKEFSSLRNEWVNVNIHRRWDVRNENRATYLARAFLTGIPYKLVERHRKPENESKFNTYILPRVESMVNKYGSYKVKITVDHLKKWTSIV